MAAVTNDQPNTGQRAAEVTRRAREAVRSLPWLNEAQAALSWAVLLALMAILGTIYVSQASRIAITGRHIQTMQLQLNENRRLNAELEQVIAEGQQLQLLQTRAVELGFVRARSEDIEYVVVPGYPVTPEASTMPVPDRLLPPETMGEAIWELIGNNFENFVEGEASDP